MGSITPYESAEGRRYRVRYRKPDRTEAEKRGFTTMREAKLYLSMVTVSKSKGEYIDPIVAIMRDAKYRDLRIINVIEVDSLPNLITNTNVAKTVILPRLCPTA